MADIEELLYKIKSKNIVSLSRAITLNESTIIEDNNIIDELLARENLLGASLVISISGIPGVGKSTFIETLGLYLSEQGYSIAVFSIDPTSELSQGSILGDKTRMSELSKLDNVYIRPSPSSNRLGGLGVNTHKNIELAKLAGYDIILVETVGVGQSETMVRQLSDIFILLQMPSSGDELQGIKKGIMEMADFFIIHKADGDLAQAAENSKKEIENSIHLTRTENMTDRIFTFSSVHKRGLDVIWDQIQIHFQHLKNNGTFVLNRKKQISFWTNELIQKITLQFFTTKYQSEFQQLKLKSNEGHIVKAIDIIKIFNLSI